MSEYLLKFTEKATGKLFLGKRITSQDYLLVDSTLPLEERLKIPVTYHRLRKNYIIDKNNKNDSCERNKKKWAKIKLSGRRAA